jgi:hypothetical protein
MSISLPGVAIPPSGAENRIDQRASRTLSSMSIGKNAKGLDGGFDSA